MSALLEPPKNDSRYEANCSAIGVHLTNKGPGEWVAGGLKDLIENDSSGLFERHTAHSQAFLRLDITSLLERAASASAAAAAPAAARAAAPASNNQSDGDDPPEYKDKNSILMAQTAAAWAKAPVHCIGSSWDKAAWQKMHMHLLSCRVLGIDTEHAEVEEAPAAAGAAAGAGSGSGASGTRGSHAEQRRVRQMALMQVAAPATPSHAACIYLIDLLPEAGVQVPLERMVTLRNILQDWTITKVIHDAREDSRLLWEQHGIAIAGVLDTQVISGMLAVSIAAEIGGAAFAILGSSMKRIGLSNLYEAHKFPYPTKAEVEQLMSEGKTASIWSQRPLPDKLLAYAASDVRYLLPLTKALLENNPRGILEGLSTLQARHYAGAPPAVTPDNVRNSPAVAAAVEAASAGGQQQQQAVMQLKPHTVYTLSIDYQGVPSYIEATPMALISQNHQQQQQQQQSNRMFDQQWQGLGAPEGGGALGVEGAAGWGAAPLGVGEVDEAVEQLMDLVPQRLRQHLQPWLDPAPSSPQLREVLLHGHSRPARVRLSDGSTLELPERVPLSEALDFLQAAKVQPTLQLMAAASYPSYDGTDAEESYSNNSWQLQSEQQSQWVRPKRQGRGRSTASSSSSSSSWLFDRDNRLSLPSSLHRISAALNREGAVVGLTYRVGRHVPGAAAPLHDVLAHMARVHRGRAPGACFTSRSEGSAAVGSSSATLAGLLGEAAGSGGSSSSPSLLLLGRPGVGKTTVLRDVARCFADDLGLSVVVVVDTSNEIAGDGDEPHPCIGNALRLQVPHDCDQAEVMLEAVQNHNPDVIIVDEIGTAQEAHAARQISQRGVMLVATAHGTSLSDLMLNPDLVRLVGGVREVTLGDEAARETNRGHKTRHERGGPGVFQVLVELRRGAGWRVHLSAEGSVDCLLEGRPADAHVRSWRGVLPLALGAAKVEGAVGQQVMGETAAQEVAGAALKAVTGDGENDDGDDADVAEEGRLGEERASKQGVDGKDEQAQGQGQLLVEFETAGAALQAAAAAAEARGGGVHVRAAGVAEGLPVGQQARGRQPQMFDGVWIVDLLRVWCESAMRQG